MQRHTSTKLLAWYSAKRPRRWFSNRIITSLYRYRPGFTAVRFRPICMEPPSKLWLLMSLGINLSFEGIIPIQFMVIPSLCLVNFSLLILLLLRLTILTSSRNFLCMLLDRLMECLGFNLASALRLSSMHFIMAGISILNPLEDLRVYILYCLHTTLLLLLLLLKFVQTPRLG